MTDRRRNYLKKYRQDNKVRLAKYRHSYNIRHKKEKATYNKKWNRKNRRHSTEHHRGTKLALFNEFPWMRYFWSARNRCYSSGEYYKKGTKFLMTKEDFKKLWFRDSARLLKKPSIDRIDPNGNYELENCRFMELSDNQKRLKLGTAIRVLKSCKDKTLRKAIEILEAYQKRN